MNSQQHVFFDVENNKRQVACMSDPGDASQCSWLGLLWKDSDAITSSYALIIIQQKLILLKDTENILWDPKEI